MDETKQPIRRRLTAKVSMLELIRPNSPWPWPYSIEIAFQALRWLLASGVGFTTPQQWQTTSVTSFLGGYSDDHAYARPIKSMEDLRERLLMAVLGRGDECIERWRDSIGLTAYAELQMKFYHYKPMAGVPHLGLRSEQDIVEILKTLLDKAPGQRTAVSLNHIHQTATAIHRVDITLSPSGFCFQLHYGFKTPKELEKLLDSEWSYVLASTQPDSVDKTRGEPFVDTLCRALAKYEFLMDPKNLNLTTTLGDRRFVEKSAVESENSQQAMA